VRFIDSHVHVSEYREQPGWAALARSSGTLMLSCGVDRATSLATLKLAEEEPGLVRAFVGIHPSEALSEGDPGWFEGALERATGAGELGLDPKYSDPGPGTPQAATFGRQLEGAERAGKPVQVHSRGAERRCLDALGSHKLKGVVMHWFQDEGLLREVCDRGYFVSFGPALIHSKRLQRMAALAEPSLVLAESDGPVGFGALEGAGGPALVPSVAFRLAELWGAGFEEARERLVKNGLAYLGTSGKT